MAYNGYIPGGTSEATQVLSETRELSWQSNYDFTQRVFPSDLGTGGASFNNHYMVININVQNASRMGAVKRNGIDVPTFGTADQGVSTRDRLRFNVDPQYTVGGQPYGGAGNFGSASRPSFTKRIKESIALYMPSTEVTYSDNHDYTNISLTKFATSFLEGGANLIGGVAQGMAGKNPFNIGNIISGTGDVVGNIAGVVMNRPINPRVELLYANTGQREFNFDFLFAPADEKESQALEQIVKTLRFHAAPEARNVTSLSGSDPVGSGLSVAGSVVDQFFWVPPSEFDITFYHNGTENTKIPKINTCVLKGIDISYAPSGVYSTFSNGYPVHTRMVLRFSEVEVINKMRVLQGF